MVARKPFYWRLTREADGAAAVEFALIVNLFLLILLASVEFGHAFFMKQIIINASREGARYAVVYKSYPNGTPIPAASLPQPNYPNTVQDWVMKELKDADGKSILPTDANPVVKPGGAGYNTATVGAELSVTVTATKTWWVINKFLPLGDNIQLSATTTMRVE